MSSALFFWLALAGYICSAIAYFSALAFSHDKSRKLGTILALVGLALHSISLGLRWSAAGHGPYVSTYEILSSNTWIAVTFFLLLQWRIRMFVHLGALVMPLAFVMMGFALMGSAELKALSPTLQSAWLLVHIVFAKLTVSGMLVAVALSIAQLLKDRRAPESGFLTKLPSVDVLDDYAYRLVAFSFITLTVMIITGSIWANNSWGHYWSWDPTETWSLVVWLVYGLYLHGRITFKWSKAFSTWYIILSFLFSIVAFFIIPYFVKSQHSQYMVG